MKTNNQHANHQKAQHDGRTRSIPVVLVRHAQSQWNRENRFTGWANPPLTEAGVSEAIEAGNLLGLHNFRFDMAYSSRLQRASDTLDILLTQLGQTHIARDRDWRLNERHYGSLQGINKAEAISRVGEQQVWRWRRGYHDKADTLAVTDQSHPVNDPTYHDVDPQLLPGVENLAQTRTRVMSFWNEQIRPRITKAERVLISAHGNTLRALLMDLSGMSTSEVESFEIPTATPIVYHFDSHARPLGWEYLTLSQTNVCA
jgi:2,3-bisphosphoglycerate-dependent phosphoglycerate mutase